MPDGDSHIEKSNRVYLCIQMCLASIVLGVIAFLRALVEGQKQTDLVMK